MSRSSTVDFTLRANITDLKSELSKIPGITEKEARKMGNAMEKNILRAEAASKKAAQRMRGDMGKAIGQAIDKTEKLAMAAGITEEHFQDLKEAAMQLGGRVDDFADQLGRADSSLSAMAGAVQHLNPEMAEAARMMGDAMGAAEGLILAAAQAPVAFTASAVAAGLLSVALADVNEEMERNQKEAERQEKLLKRVNNLSDKRAAIEDKLTDAVERQRGTTDEATRAWQKNEQEIAATIAQAEKLAKLGKTHRLHSLAMSTQEWGKQQRALNDELLRFSQIAKQNERDQRIQANQYEILRTATQDRLADMDRLAQRARETGKVIVAAELEAAAGMYSRDLVADKVIQTEAQRQKGIYETASALTAQLIEEGKAQEAARQTQGLFKNNSSYNVKVKDAERVAKALKAQTGAEWQLYDAMGAVIISADDYSKRQRTGRKEYLTGVFLQNLQTEATLEYNDAVRLKRKLSAEADKEEKRAESEAAEAKKAATDQKIEALQREVAGINETADARIQAIEDEKKSEGVLLAEVLAAENERLDAIKASLEEEKRLTDEAAKQIKEARESAVSAYFASVQALEDERFDESKAAVQEQQQIEREALQERLEGISEKANQEEQALIRSKMGAVELLELERNQQLAELDMLRETLTARGDLTLEAEQELAHARFLIQSNANEKILDSQVELTQGAIKQFGDLGMTLLGDLSNFIETRAEDMADKDRQRALRMFRLHKGIAISEAVISGAQGVMEVWKQYASNPPLAALMSAPVIAMTALKVATIKSQEPSFHLGGVRPMSDPSEYNARVLPGEAVLNRQATEALGDTGVEALNTGGAPSIQVVPIPVYKHFDRFIRDENKRGGRFSNIVQAQSDRPLGQRGY